ncbi:hypothetical protein AMK14_04925 [Streptomyces sp. TSRI0445]|uniref:DUF3017 domain-containing protein n=1 Tax=Streptomyces TaxID=1883 RepID=UPI00093BFE06|nr:MULTISPECIES: DUF3017 domain-containing protein [unclassified Streptomyces]OKI72631.1 hypothetical protein AMK14_04925 [Streptomyces sp. TSRI0445]UIZ14958.1 DUF3017 domain-containing protein [Streptomyces sp. R527F]
MGAGRSPADPAPAGETDGRSDRDEGASEAPASAEAEAAEGQGGRDETAAEAADGQGGSDGSSGGPGESGGSGGSAGSGESGVSVGQSDAAPADGPAPTGRPRRSRRFPRFTRDTARPEGGGRAASGDAPAPARQWPLLTVLCAAGLGLLIVVLDPFEQAFRIGTILIGGALITGAVLRWVVPSVGMLAVRSRFTDLVTYGVMGTLIVLLALVAQPEPWLDVPILEDAVRFTIR